MLHHTTRSCAFAAATEDDGQASSKGLLGKLQASAAEAATGALHDLEAGVKKGMELAGDMADTLKDAVLGDDGEEEELSPEEAWRRARLFREDWQLVVEKAPEPDDVIWEGLRTAAVKLGSKERPWVGVVERYLRQLVALMVVIGVACLFTWVAVEPIYAGGGITGCSVFMVRVCVRGAAPHARQ